MRVIVRRPARHAEAFITPCLSIGPMETCTTGSPIPTRLWPESALTNASTSTSAPVLALVVITGGFTVAVAMAATEPSKIPEPPTRPDLTKMTPAEAVSAMEHYDTAVQEWQHSCWNWAIRVPVADAGAGA